MPGNRNPLHLIIFMFELFESYFWEVSTSMVNLIVPILALFLVFRLVHDLLFKGSL